MSDRLSAQMILICIGMVIMLSTLAVFSAAIVDRDGVTIQPNPARTDR